MKFFERFYLDHLDISSQDYVMGKIAARRRENNYEPFSVMVESMGEGQARGTKGSVWVAQKGNLYISLGFNRLFREDFFALASEAAWMLLKDRVHDLRMVLPNDLYRNDKKLGGILVETHKDITLLGFGLNVSNPPLLEDVKTVGLEDVKDLPSIKELGDGFVDLLLGLVTKKEDVR